jgi:cytochrome c2
MRQALHVAAVLAAWALAAAPAAAEGEDADAGSGAELAQEACAMCHQLPDGTGNAVAPPLAELAQQQGPFDAARLHAVLEQAQHAPARPKVDLETQSGALVDYLNALR